MKGLILFLFILLFNLPSTVVAQVNNGYLFTMSLDNGLQRKMFANEVLIDDNNKYLVVNYGNKPTYIVVFEYGTWTPIVNFRLPDWVEFSGAYFENDSDDFYIKASRYSSEYYKLTISTGKQELRECETLPGGCPVVEPKQNQKEIYTSDKSYFIEINKKNTRDVRVYRKR